MLRFKLVYSDDRYLPLGNHGFTGQKYRLVYQQILGQRIADPEDFVAPKPATNDDVLLAHTWDWVRKLRQGTLSSKEQLELEMPYSADLVDAFWLHAGASIMAAELALHDGIGISIGGGFHHAFPDHGEGFCMINDVAIAVRRLLKNGKVAHAMVLDCDVHQGNGTEMIFGADPSMTNPQPAWSANLFQPVRPVSMKEAAASNVFTVSLHQENNYPAWKPPSSIDVNLPDGTSDAEYLDWLDNAITSGFRQFEPDLIAYIAGADPYKDDQLGGLGLSIDGLKQHDELVFSVCKQHRIPIFVTYGGGYARNLEDTITIHANTARAAKEIYGSR